MTVSDLVDVDALVDPSHHRLMRMVRRSLEEAGLEVVDELDRGDEGSGMQTNRQPQLVLVGGKSRGWHGTDVVTFGRSRLAGSPVVVLTVFDDEESARAAMAPEARGETGAASTLTPREVEVLRALANGASTIQVARSLFISHKTVKNHLAHIYSKLGASSRTQAVANAVRLGIVRIA